MRYWLWITTIENGLIAIENGVIGISERFKKPLDHILKGDRGFIYIKTSRGEYPITKPGILAEFVICSDIYYDKMPMFKPKDPTSSEIYPIRFAIKAENVFERLDPFEKYVERLEFIKNKGRWGMYFMGKAMVEISKEDYEIIRKL